MQFEGQRLYSVLTKKEILAKIIKQIHDVSEIFSESKSAALVMLVSLRWNLFKVSDRLGDDKDKFLEESGLKPNCLNEDESTTDSTCGVCFESSTTCVVFSTPFCSHSFCTTCWREYLGNCLENYQRDKISCPDPDCNAAVGLDTIRQLSDTVKKKYQKYILRSFMEGNKESMRWCPAPGCKYIIELQDEEDQEEECNGSVVCRCSHVFCWKCQNESHRPVTCSNASDWNRLVGVTDGNLSVAWIAANTKPCPSCFSPIELVRGACRFVKCLSPCSYHFCWKCLKSKEDHWECHEAFVPPEAPLEIRERWESVISSRESYSLCSLYIDRFKTGHREVKLAISNLREIENSKIPELGHKFSTSIQSMEFVREAWMLIIHCRQILKWSHVYGYFLAEHETAKKQYLHYLQEEATNTLLRFSEAVKTETEHAPYSRTLHGLDCFKLKVSDLTSKTRKYFHGFLMTLEGGILEVKVKAYDYVADKHWFCDRCTYQNTWLDVKCKMCFDS